MKNNLYPYNLFGSNVETEIFNNAIYLWTQHPFKEGRREFYRARLLSSLIWVPLLEIKEQQRSLEEVVSSCSRDIKRVKVKYY
jgi:hypothetical protein